MHIFQQEHCAKSIINYTEISDITCLAPQMHLDKSVYDYNNNNPASIDLLKICAALPGMVLKPMWALVNNQSLTTL